MFDYKKENVKKIDFTKTTEVNKAISAVSKGYAKLRGELHAVLVAAARHSVLHSDASCMTNLVNSLGNDVNKRNGIDKWVRKYTTLTWGKDAIGNPKYLGKNKVYSFIEDGENVPFYKMDTVADANSMVFDDENLFRIVQGLISKSGKETAALSETGRAFVDTIATAMTQFAPKEEKKKAA
jgi:hypothetical protein